MKWLYGLSAAIVLAAAGAALAASPVAFRLTAQEDSAQRSGEASPAADEAAPDLPPTFPEEPPLPPTPPLAGALHAPVPGAAWGGGYGCGLGLRGCCEREYSPLDGLWSNYCAEKPHCHPASTMFGWLHIHRSQHTAPCPACPQSCDCRFGLPTLRGPKMLCGSPACADPLNAASDNVQSWPAVKYGVVETAGEQEGIVTEAPAPAYLPPATAETAPAPRSAPKKETFEEPAVPAPAPEDLLPDLPPAEGAPHDAQGWLPLPRLKLLPL